MLAPTLQIQNFHGLIIGLRRIWARETTNMPVIVRNVAPQQHGLRTGDDGQKAFWHFARLSIVVSVEIPVDETRKRKRQEQRCRDRIELPGLRCNLPGSLFKCQANTADCKVKQQQLAQPQPGCFRFRQGNHGHQAVADKRQIGRTECHQHQNPDGYSLRHRGLAAGQQKIAQVPIICEIALAQSAIRPPGRIPRPSTNAPLRDSTVRTSSDAETVLAVMGSSKYMTLTTRR